MQDAAEKEQLVVVVGAGAQAAACAMGSGEDVAADAVVENELWGRSFGESICLSGDVGVGEGQRFKGGRECVGHCAVLLQLRDEFGDVEGHLTRYLKGRQMTGVIQARQG